jgi:DNA-binding LacI/PurR family transcriptional regulator
MSDVAARAGVSRALVSIVFRDAPGASAATRERVLKAADELSYRPDQRARLLGRSRSRTLGVVFSLGYEFHAELVEQVYAAAERRGYEIALGAAAPSRGERRAAQSLLGFRCEAVLLVGPSLPAREIEELAARQPVVVLARALRSQTVDVVRTDDTGGARLAVEHLLGLGHADIAHVHGRRAPGAAERRRGYREAMRRAGLDGRVRLVEGGLTEEDGERAARTLLDGPMPSAVTVFNDLCATGLLGAVRAAGADVPGSLSVVGYDNSHVARLSTVALTTVSQDASALAERAVERAVGRVEGELEGAEEVVVPPRLVVRRTTGPVPG